MGIELKGVSLSYGSTQVLSNFSVTLPDTGFLCFLGPSGSGKTTLLRLLAGLLAPDSGKILGLEGCKRSMVFQEDRLLPWYTALQNTALSGGNEPLAKEILAALGLGAALGKKPGELSGGMCRRVALARSLCYGGDIYLMDEPLKGLDTALKERVMDELHTRTAGALVILVTHEAEEALALADEIYWFSGTPLRLERRETLSLSYIERKNKKDFYQRYKRNEP